MVLGRPFLYQVLIVTHLASPNLRQFRHCIGRFRLQVQLNQMFFSWGRPANACLISSSVAPILFPLYFCWWLPHKNWSSPKRVPFFSRVTEQLSGLSYNTKLPPFLRTAYSRVSLTSRVPVLHTVWVGTILVGKQKRLVTFC